MMARFFSLVTNKQFTTVLFFLSAVLSGLLVTGQSHSEDLVDETSLSNDDQFYQGVVNFTHRDTFELIVDDYTVKLSPVLRFNNASSSRERVIQNIEPGDLIRMELGGDTNGDDSHIRTVRSITVIDQ